MFTKPLKTLIDRMTPFFNPNSYGWFKIQDLPTEQYTCGYCSDKVASGKGYKIGGRSDGSAAMIGAIYICPSCHGPTFVTPDDKHFPDAPYGNPVLHVPNELNLLYEEARKCTSSNYYTGSVLLCRKMLMHIAVGQGADKDKAFLYYVTYLYDKHFIPPNGKHWVDHIRQKGNEANHEIRLMSQKDAHDLLIFIEMLLKFIYEFPQMVPASDT